MATTYKTDLLAVWVLHSPYPDGTWRGIEKCCSREDGLPILFESKGAALDFERAHGLQADGYVPVQVTLITPWVRRSLDVAACSDRDAELVTFEELARTNALLDEGATKIAELRAENSELQEACAVAERDEARTLAERDEARRLYVRAVNTEYGSMDYDMLATAAEKWGRTAALALYPDDELRRELRGHSYAEDQIDEYIAENHRRLDEAFPEDKS